MSTLYRIETELGDYWVVAEDPTNACTKLERMLHTADYGFSNKRRIKSITIIAEECNPDYMTGKFLIP